MAILVKTDAVHDVHIVPTRNKMFQDYAMKLMAKSTVYCAIPRGIKVLSCPDNVSYNETLSYHRVYYFSLGFSFLPSLSLFLYWFRFRR